MNADREYKCGESAMQRLGTGTSYTLLRGLGISGYLNPTLAKL